MNDDHNQRHNIELKVNVRSIQQTLTFQIPNKQMFEDLCPKWKDQNQIDIEKITDLNQIFNFFNSIINQSNEPQFAFLDDTFAELSLQSGYHSQIMHQLLEKNDTNQNSNIDFSNIENMLSLNYSNLLDDPQSNLILLDIQKHHRILTNALKQNNFPYSKFAQFIKKNIENKPEIVFLLSELCISNFDENDVEDLKTISNIFSYFNNSDLYALYKENKQLRSENERLKEEIKTLQNFNEQHVEILSNLQNLENQINNCQASINENQNLKSENILQEIQNVRFNLKTDIQGSQNEILSHVDYIDKFPHQNSNQFNGILNKLKQINSIEIQHGAELYENHKATNLIDYSSDACFRTLNHGDSDKNWLEFDFKSKRVVLSGYEIKAPNVTCNLTKSPDVKYMATPKSWKMLGSNDQSSWVTLDTQENRSELNGINNVGYFECKTPIHKGYRYIRFVQNDCWNESVAPSFQYDINIAKFELYGKILE